MKSRLPPPFLFPQYCGLPLFSARTLALAADDTQLLLAIADYLNNSGGVSNPWIPSLGDSNIESHLKVDWLSPEEDPAVPWEGSAQAMGIKTRPRGQVGELEILIHLEEDEMGFSGDPDPHQLQQQDRERVKQLLKRTNGRSSPASQTPALETIDELEVDPFGSFLSQDELQEVQAAEPTPPEGMPPTGFNNADNPPPTTRRLA